VRIGKATPARTFVRNREILDAALACVNRAL
jgi:hypothetical protein